MAKRPQGDVDHQRGEVVEVQREQRGRAALAVLIRLDAHFQVPPPDQRRHAHAVVIDQLELPGGVTITLACCRSPWATELSLSSCTASSQRSAICGDGVAIAFQAAGAEPMEERLALHPVHEDQRIPLAVARRADAAVAILEIHEAIQPAALADSR